MLTNRNRVHDRAADLVFLHHDRDHFGLHDGGLAFGPTVLNLHPVHEYPVEGTVVNDERG